MKCPCGVFIIIMLILMGLAAGYDIADSTSRPLIWEESVKDVYFDGAWGTEYQYYVNGELCVAFVRKGDLEAYKAYLGKLGIFTIKAKERKVK